MVKSMRRVIVTVSLLMISFLVTPGQAQSVINITMSYAPESSSYIEGDNGFEKRFNDLYAQRINPVTGQPLGPDEPIVFMTATSVNSGEVAALLYRRAEAWESDESQYPTIYQPSTRNWLLMANATLDKPIFNAQAAPDTAISYLTIGIFDEYYQRFSDLGGGAPGWNTLTKLLQNPNGWGTVDVPDLVGYAHTNPHISSSGLSALIALYYTLARQQGLVGANQPFPERIINAENLSDAYKQLYSTVTRRPAIAFEEIVANLESGTDYVHLMPLEENVVIDYNCRVLNPNRPEPTYRMTAVYPADGTFVHTHPMAIPNPGYWVDDMERQAAQRFIDFVLLKEQQEIITNKGFRPVHPDVPLSPLFSQDCGAAVQVNAPLLAMPDYTTVNTMQARWTVPNPTDYILVVDTSGSMRECEPSKMSQAQSALQRFVIGLDPLTTVTVIEFSDSAKLIYPQVPQTKESREQLLLLINQLVPDGNTALFRGISNAIDITAEKITSDTNSGDNERAYRIIILSDGANDDRDDSMTIEQLAQQIRSLDDSGYDIQFFPIFYDTDITRCDSIMTQADITEAQSHMQQIATASDSNVIFASGTNINTVLVKLLNALQEK